jgi:probable H4MPT-linked C1 transfer pathway protein
MLALDIGGANLKAADGLGWAATVPFPLWKQPQDLAGALRGLIAQAPLARTLAATMTGELADCFASKAEGVERIVRALMEAAGDCRALVYLVDGAWATPEQAIERPWLAAASNWHALAAFAGRFAPRGAAWLLDVGSTTCDIIPLQDGAPVASGQTDPDRLRHGELVYTGVERSPICAIVRELPWRGNTCPVAQEVFATTWDAYLLLGDVPEEPASTHTADGRPATRSAALDRLARMICADRTMFGPSDAFQAARVVAEEQLALLEHATRRVIALRGRPTRVVISGQGEFLARRLIERLRLDATIVALSDELGPVVSRCAPAHALAVLARERADG